jgi:LPXTG-motif cell wall-anchored protein
MPSSDPLPLVMASSGAGSVLLAAALLFIGKRRKRP